MRNFLSSLACACNGIRYAYSTERNMRIHLLVFVLALILGLILHISKIEFMLILAISALNFSLELVNTAIERLADKISPQYDEKIGVIKDVMAGAVLVSTVFAISIGCLILFEPLLKFIQP